MGKFYTTTEDSSSSQINKGSSSPDSAKVIAAIKHWGKLTQNLSE